MYKTFEDAKKAALLVINEKYDGDKMLCVVTESKISKKSRKPFFGFHFYDTDTQGEFVTIGDGTWEKRTMI